MSVHSDHDMTGMDTMDEETNNMGHEANADGIPSWCMHTKYQSYWRHRQQVTDWFNARVFKGDKQHYGAESQHKHYRAMADYHFSMAQLMLKLSTCYANYYQTWQEYEQKRCIPNFSPAAPHVHTKTPENLGRGSCHNFMHQRHQSSPQTKRESNKRKGSQISHTQKRQDLRRSPVTSRPTQHHDSSDDENVQYQMEITDEMMEFYAQSAQHRQQRDARKLKAAEDEKGKEHINLGDVSARPNKATKEPPSERPGAKRTEEMKKLYGKGAAMIHGMETAMQLNYDRNCDRQQPKLWPHLPINIVF